MVVCSTKIASNKPWQLFDNDDKLENKVCHGSHEPACKQMLLSVLYHKLIYQVCIECIYDRLQASSLDAASVLVSEHYKRLLPRTAWCEAERLFHQSCLT